MPKSLFSYRVPMDYQSGAETGKAWEAWFDSLGSSVEIGAVPEIAENPRAGTDA